MNHILGGLQTSCIFLRKKINQFYPIEFSRGGSWNPSVIPFCLGDFPVVFFQSIFSVFISLWGAFYFNYGRIFKTSSLSISFYISISKTFPPKPMIFCDIRAY